MFALHLNKYENMLAGPATVGRAGNRGRDRASNRLPLRGGLTTGRKLRSKDAPAAAAPRKAGPGTAGNSISFRPTTLPKEGDEGVEGEGEKW
jgi:hypothetical protein